MNRLPSGVHVYGEEKNRALLADLVSLFFAIPQLGSLLTEYKPYSVSVITSEVVPPQGRWYSFRVVLVGEIGYPVEGTHARSHRNRQNLFA